MLGALAVDELRLRLEGLAADAVQPCVDVLVDVVAAVVPDLLEELLDEPLVPVVARADEEVVSDVEAGGERPPRLDDPVRVLLRLEALLGRHAGDLRRMLVDPREEERLTTALPLVAGTLGDLAGGSISDIWARRTGNLTLARRGVAVFGFLLAAGSIVPATFTPDPERCVWLTCLAVFGLELTVGVSWAVPLDIGGDYAGSVSSVINTFGNIGGAILGIVSAWIAHRAIAPGRKSG